VKAIAIIASTLVLIVSVSAQPEEQSRIRQEIEKTIPVARGVRLANLKTFFPKDEPQGVVCGTAMLRRGTNPAQDEVAFIFYRRNSLLLAEDGPPAMLTLARLHIRGLCR
jgi:hypothetical protein